VPWLTPSFAAKVACEQFDFMRCFVSNVASDWVLFCQGGESALMALITRWQKGFRNHPFRQNCFNNVNMALLDFLFFTESKEE
jgi:hypothetical protein